MTTFTPGPWKIFKGEAFGGASYVIYDAYDHIKDENGMRPTPIAEMRKVDDANKLLMEAAPDLLEVAELFRAELALCMEMTGPLAEKVLTLEAKVNAAIAKAKGTNE